MANLRIALVAGEASGDILGAGLMRALKAQHPAVEFIGVGGPLMQAEGLTSYFPMERLSVMGLVEVLGRLRELLARRKLLIKTLIEEKPDVFIGIDAPDFTLNIELKLRQAGIKTVHYVSPSVWAWRQKRVLKIREGCDLMLTLLPFEARFYEEKGVPVRFVGHTLADAIPLQADRAAARAELGLPDGPLVALMPGSRGGEVGRLGALFLDTAERLLVSTTGYSLCLAVRQPATSRTNRSTAGRSRPAVDPARWSVSPGPGGLRCRVDRFRYRHPGGFAVQAAHGRGLPAGAADLLDSQAHGQEPLHFACPTCWPSACWCRSCCRTMQRLKHWRRPCSP